LGSSSSQCRESSPDPEIILPYPRFSSELFHRNPKTIGKLPPKIFYPTASTFLYIITIYSSNNLTGISFATCYGTHNRRCTIEGWLKVPRDGSEESSWKKKNFQQFLGTKCPRFLLNVPRNF
jgi:hypothetical protein